MFDIPTLEDTTEFMVSMFKALFPTANVSEYSPTWKMLRTFAGGVTDNHAHLFAVQNDLLPDTAAEGMLDRWGRIKGVVRKSATPARKSLALRVFGTTGTAIAALLELVHSSGLRFKIETATSIGAAGYVDCNIVAIDTGTQTRLSAGETLQFTATPVGASEVAELQLAIDEDGVDAESDASYRDRVLSRFSDPPLGGAQHDYVQWCLDQVGINDAYAYPVRNGLGSVDVAAFHAGTGAARSLAGGEVVALQATLEELKPSGATVRVLTTVPVPWDVEITLRSNGESKYVFDWDDSTPPVVSVWDSLLRKMTFAAPRPATMVAGDRIIIDGLGTTGEQAVIESLSGVDAVILRDVPAVIPAPSIVYSGGPLVDSVRAAIIAHFATLGPTNPDSIRYGAWDANLRPGALLRISSTVAGVLDATVIAPAVTIEASDDPSVSTIFYLVPGKVLIRGGV